MMQSINTPGTQSHLSFATRSYALFREFDTSKGHLELRGVLQLVRLRWLSPAIVYSHNHVGKSLTNMHDDEFQRGMANSLCSRVGTPFVPLLAIMIY